jgi:hypothetical protein
MNLRGNETCDSILLLESDYLPVPSKSPNLEREGEGEKFYQLSELVTNSSVNKCNRRPK